MLSTVLLPVLQQRFPNRELQMSTAPEPCAVFPAIHPDVGDIKIYDDGDELTLVAGNFTHGHFSNYDNTLSAEAKEREIVEGIVQFLDELFADRVVFWGSHKGSGGWYRIDRGAMPRQHEATYVWSGPREGD